MPPWVVDSFLFVCYCFGWSLLVYNRRWNAIIQVCNCKSCFVLENNQHLEVVYIVLFALYDFVVKMEKMI